MIPTELEHFRYALRIERGRTKHPERPISQDRFLIGAGSNCHLQLGGEMPILHSVIVESEQGLWIDAIVREPQLLVNRQPVQASHIVAGDLIEIGDFVFVLVEHPVELQSDIIDDHNENVDLRELSAEELVDLLAEELRQLSELDLARESGAQALLDLAARSNSPTMEHSSGSGAVDFELLTEQLEQRASALSQREEVLAEKANHLQRAQERLEKYLERLSAQLIEDSGDDNSIRRTA